MHCIRLLKQKPLKLPRKSFFWKTKGDWALKGAVKKDGEKKLGFLKISKKERIFLLILFSFLIKTPFNQAGIHSEIIKRDKILLWIQHYNIQKNGMNQLININILTNKISF